MPYGLSSMLKDGHKHFSGVDEAVMKNIDACKALAQITRTSMGPNGVFMIHMVALGAALDRHAGGGDAPSMRLGAPHTPFCASRVIGAPPLAPRHEQDGDQSPGAPVRY